jgi:hypothetical protein
MDYDSRFITSVFVIVAILNVYSCIRFIDGHPWDRPLGKFYGQIEDNSPSKDKTQTRPTTHTITVGREYLRILGQVWNANPTNNPM